MITTNAKAKEQGAKLERQFVIDSINYRLGKMQAAILEQPDSNRFATLWGFAIAELLSLKHELEDVDK